MDGASPTVSVLLPVRDAAGTLGAAVRSVLRQSERRLECLIVDDGSTDGSGELAAALGRDDPRVRVLHTPARGIVHALNAGLELARAPLVARMDADDVMRRERLARQRAALDDATLAGVGCHVRLFPRRDLSDGMLRYERWLASVRDAEDVAREAFVEMPLVHPTLTLRTDVLRRHRYRDTGGPEDYDLLLRLLASGARLGVVPARLHAWREGPGRMQRRDPRYALERFTEAKAAALADGLLAHRDTYVLWGYGDTGRALCRALEDHGRRPSHIVELHPGRLGQRIAGAPVIPPDGLADVLAAGAGPVLASVAGPDARGKLRAALDVLGLVEGAGYVVTA